MHSLCMSPPPRAAHRAATPRRATRRARRAVPGVWCSPTGLELSGGRLALVSASRPPRRNPSIHPSIPIHPSPLLGHPFARPTLVSHHPFKPNADSPFNSPPPFLRQQQHYLAPYLGFDCVTRAPSPLTFFDFFHLPHSSPPSSSGWSAAVPTPFSYTFPPLHSLSTRRSPAPASESAWVPFPPQHLGCPSLRVTNIPRPVGLRPLDGTQRHLTPLSIS